MFKSLRDRLRGVSEKLEAELDAQLEAELEAELQASLQSHATPDEEATPPSGPGPEPVPEPSAVPQEAEPVAPVEDAAVESSSVCSSVQETEDAAMEPASQPDATEPGRQTPAEAPAPRDEPGASEASSVAEAPTQTQEPQPLPLGPAREPTAPAKPAPKQEKYGRKFLSEEEIEARLQRELSEAVETQREVEAVVQETSTGRTRFTINEDVLEDILWELEVGLLESDVALPVIEAIKDNVKEQLLSMRVGGHSPHEVVEKVLRTSVRRVLNVNPIDFDAFVRDRLASGKKPVVVMFVGVNGTGKTTSIARIAYRMKQQGIGCVLAAGDTFRAGAIEQLSQHADKLGVKIVKHSAGADPAAVAYDAIEHAKARNKDLVLLDTAGRMQTNTNLMDEMDKIRRVANPDLVVFVGDSLAGNDAVEQARRFDEVVDIDGVILTKVDVDAKGGAALSVAYTINKPLLFVGVGQDYPDLRPFDAGWMVDRLFGDETEA